MPLTYADLLPVTARGLRQPGPAEPPAPGSLDLRWLSPPCEPIWSFAGRRTRPAGALPAAERRRMSRDRRWQFQAELDLEIRLAALTRGHDDEAGLRMLVAPNHSWPADAPASGASPRAV